MRWEHLGAFMWLRWRLFRNQLRRGGTANVVILAILLAGAVILAGILFVSFFLIGMFALAKAEPPVLMYVWDGVVGAFLFFWMIGIVSDLQRSEAVALDKFLHLPVSLSCAFVLNYVSSLLSFNLILFVPAMMGLSLGLAFSHGPLMLLLFPLVTAFLLMITALTYQFQGWLASLMVNKRRRRTIIFLVTAVFVLLSQLPNLLNIMQPWNSGKQKGDELAVRLAQKQADLQRARTAGQITEEQYQQQQRQAVQRFQAESQEKNQRRNQDIERLFRIGNLILPPGWLPLGALGMAEGNVLPALLGTLGLGLIGVGSLWRAYRTTVRLYTGQFTGGKKRSARPPPAVDKTSRRPRRLLVEEKLPWLSEQATALTLACFRSLMRAPEAKMLLLSPVILLVVFGGIFLRGPLDMPEQVRPLMAFGAMAMILFTMVQLVGNQFGFDRGGFRVFVLSPASRRDILLGKNLAFAPFALGLGTMAVVFIELVLPMRLDYFVAVFPQMLSMYLLFCLLANCVSIITPMAVAPGTLRPTNTKAIPILLHMALVLLMPLALSPTLLPLGIEAALEALGWRQGIPVCLLLTLLEVVVVAVCYRLVLGWEGAFLQAREKRILEIVAAKAE